MNYLCEASQSNPIVVYVILAVLVVAMLILPYFTQKKKNQQYMDMLSAIKVGDLVKTAGGIIGRITKITDKGDIKTVLLETGSKTDKSIIELDITSIYCVLKSTKTEEVSEESVGANEKEEKQPAKKTSSKKNTKKEEKQSAKVEEIVEVEPAQVVSTEVEPEVQANAETVVAKKTTKKIIAKKTTKKTTNQ